MWKQLAIVVLSCVLLFFIWVEYYMIFCWSTKTSGLSLVGVKAKDSNMMGITKCVVKSSKFDPKKIYGILDQKKYCIYDIFNPDLGNTEEIWDPRRMIDLNNHDPRPCERVGAMIDCHYLTEHYPNKRPERNLWLGNPSDDIIYDSDITAKYCLSALLLIFLIMPLIEILCALTRKNYVPFGRY